MQLPWSPNFRSGYGYSLKLPFDKPVTLSVNKEVEMKPFDSTQRFKTAQAAAVLDPSLERRTSLRMHQPLSPNLP